MSDQTVVMNISETSPYLSGFCDLKCDYSFYYKLSNCTIAPTVATNSLYYFYESNSNGVPQVLYNGIEYVVSGVHIILSSTHFYNGNLAEAEIHITHSPYLGNGLPLDVCIPITSSPGAMPNDKGAKMIMQMIIGGIEAINLNDYRETSIDNTISSINSSVSNLNSETSQIEGELPKTRKKRDDDQGVNITNDQSNIQTNLTKLSEQLKSDYFDNALSVNMRNVPYILESIIPVKTPFFSYTNTNNNTYNVVYSMTNAIFVEYDMIEWLQTTLTPYYSNPAYIDTVISPSTTANIYPLFLNNTGATSLMTTNLSDEIYIDCQPTGSSNQQTNITTSTDPSGVQIKTSSVTFFIYVIFFIFVLVIIYMVFAYITHPDKKNFSLGNMKNPFT